MEQAIHKMTEMPAHRMKPSRRGTLSEGNFADINLFDPAEVRDRSVFENSKQLSVGMRMVFVNGKIAWQNEKRILQQQGRVLKSSDMTNVL